ncbi:MAG: c-type cytochrome [Dichotomicrobium sp.]
MVCGVTAAGLVLVTASLPARGYGECAYRGGCGDPGHACTRWDDCRYDSGECGYRSGCYYGPADPPPRHKWRPRPKWTPEKHAWRDARKPAPPPPERRPKREPDGDVAASQPEQGEDDGRGEATETGDANGIRPRHKAAANGEIPERYRQMRNEVGHTLTAIRNGVSLYRDHCDACHGAAGEGDGPRAQEASPSLPALPHTLARDFSTDAYLIWTIMQGGEPIGTDKPAFEDKLSERQAWQIIAYMRAGFPARGPSKAVRQTMQTQTTDDGHSTDR